MDEPLRLREKAEVVEEEFRESMVTGWKTAIFFRDRRTLCSRSKAVMAMAAGTGPDDAWTGQKLPGISVKKKFGLTVKSVNSYQNGFELLIK